MKRKCAILQTLPKIKKRIYKKFLTKYRKYYIIYDMPMWWNRQTQGT